MAKKLLVGLGNPGPRYAMTRHNAGFIVVDAFVDDRGGRFGTHKRTNVDVAEFPDVIVVKPRSMMNLSGGPVKNVASFFKVPPADIIVVHDELDLDLGQVVHKVGGGGNGHNGLRDITKALSTPDYQRIRVGIGRPPGRMAPAKFVLEDFSKRERDELPIVAADAADLIVTLL